MTRGTLYLIPCTLGSVQADRVLPSHAIDIARKLQHYVVEEPKSARQFLSSINHANSIQSLDFATLNEHTKASELPTLIAPLLEGKDVGLISEAGCPGIADPGADLVALAHQKNIRVIPLVGPSSIFLALMASGLNGQCFAFHGYLPIEQADRSKAIAALETESFRRRQTQMFIETPYRNDKLFAALLAQCRPDTRLCIASDITLATEEIQTRNIAEWKRIAAPDLKKRPSIFLLLASH